MGNELLGKHTRYTLEVNRAGDGPRWRMSAATTESKVVRWARRDAAITKKKPTGRHDSLANGFKPN